MPSRMVKILSSRDAVFCQFLFKLALFCHQIRNAGISEQLLLIFGSHAVQQAFEFLIDLRNADLYFNALVLSGPGTEAQPNVLLEGLQDIRVDLRCFQNCIHDGVLQWCFFPQCSASDGSIFCRSPAG